MKYKKTYGKVFVVVLGYDVLGLWLVEAKSSVDSLEEILLGLKERSQHRRVLHRLLQKRGDAPDRLENEITFKASKVLLHSLTIT